MHLAYKQRGMDKKYLDKKYCVYLDRKYFIYIFYICICIIYMCTNMNFILVIFIDFFTLQHSVWDIHNHCGFTAICFLASQHSFIYKQRKPIMN